MIVAATFHEFISAKRTCKSTRIPTEIKNKGINKAFPTKLTRFIKTEECGINRFKPKPAINAPIIGSTFANSAMTAEAKTTSNAKMNCDVPSDSTFLKNQRAMRGKMPMTTMRKKANEMLIFKATSSQVPPFAVAVMKDNSKSAAVSVMIVPPTVIVTASFFVTPKRETIGYEMSVCVAYMEASNKQEMEMVKIGRASCRERV